MVTRPCCDPLLLLNAAICFLFYVGAFVNLRSRVMFVPECKKTYIIFLLVIVIWDVCLAHAVIKCVSR